MKMRTASLFLVFALVACSGLMRQTESRSPLPSADTSVTVLTPPYLQNMSQTGMVVMAEVAENIPLAVEYGKTTGYGFTVPMKLNASGGGTNFCRAVISGLEPGTTYNYRLILPSGEGITGNATFTTSPAGWEDFSFAALGDTQQGNTVGSHGDRKYWEADPWEPGNSMFRHMVEQDISLFLGIGDHAADGDDYSRTRLSYLDRMAAILGQHVPYFISWGNHDGNSPDHPLRLAADMPSRWRTDNLSVHSPGFGSFAFEYSGVFFICLEHFTTTALEADDPANDITNGWLDSVLSSQIASDARFRILSVHVPPFCERWTHGNAKLREHLVPRLEKYNVDICFSGHMHGYERGYLNGVHYIIAGGGSYLDCFEPLVYEWPHMFIGGQVNGESSNVPGEYRRQSSYGVLGPPEPIDGGIFHGYAGVTVRDHYLRVDMHGFNADGSYIGILDSFEIKGADPLSFQ